MPKTLTLSEPELSIWNSRVYAVKWDLLDEDGAGYYISWFEKAFDTLKPECMAVACKYDERGMRRTDWHKRVVNHNPDAALALDEVLKQLKEKHGYEYNTEVEVQLLPGEVVADGNR